MEQYFPRTASEFHKRFQSEEACWQYLVEIRWPNGFRCPKCGAEKGWLNRRHCYECKQCHRQTSVTAGTIFQDTRKPLRLWFQVMWWVMNQKYGASASKLIRALPIDNYKTAWIWLHKLRRVMDATRLDQLTGMIEVDKIRMLGSKIGKRLWHAGTVSVIAVAAQIDRKDIGKIRLCLVSDTSEASLRRFVEDSIRPGSVIVTDGWGSPEGLEEYTHQARVITRGHASTTALLPHTHHIGSLFKRWLLKTHRGAVSGNHLAYYLAEFTYRFNRREFTHHGKLFCDLVQQAVNMSHCTYNDIRRIWW